MIVVVGYHAIEESIRSGIQKGELHVSERSGRIRHLIGIARDMGVHVRFVDSAELDRMSNQADHRGAVYLAPETGQPAFKELDIALHEASGAHPLVLLLDGITDPHNLGAILRSADMFSVSFVVLPGRRTAHVNPTVIKTSAGASAHVPMASVPNLTQAIESLKKAGFWIYGAAMEGEPIHTVDLKGQIALVLGSEGSGIGRLVKEHCDGLLEIPTAGHIDSLNVSVAAGICMYEIRRQQGFFS